MGLDKVHGAILQTFLCKSFPVSVLLRIFANNLKKKNVKVHADNSHSALMKFSLLAQCENIPPCICPLCF